MDSSCAHSESSIKMCVYVEMFNVLVSSYIIIVREGAPGHTVACD